MRSVRIFSPPQEIEASSEIRRFCIDLGLTQDKVGASEQIHSRICRRIDLSFAADREEYENAGSRGYALRRRNSLPYRVGSATLDYQLELPF